MDTCKYQTSASSSGNAMNAPADELTMLLSSHWFLDNWYLLGLRTSRSQRLIVRDCLEALVRSFVPDGADYWSSDFSERRLQSTKDALLNAFAMYSDERSDIDVLRRLTTGELDAVGYGFDSTLMLNCLQLLLNLNETPSQVEFQIEKDVALAIDIALHDQHSLDSFRAIEFSSAWDIRLAKITPDLPEYLYDVLCEFHRFSIGAPAVWARINSEINSEQGLKLRSTLNRLSESLVGSRIIH